MTDRDLLPLRTERLVLRRLRPADLPVLLAYRNDEELARYQGWALPFSADEGREFIAQNAETPLTDGGGVQIAVALADTDELAGDLYLGRWGDERLGVMGYTLARQHHGRGYGTEAAGGLLRLAFAGLGLHRVVATVDPRNRASIAVLERLGLRREGHFIQGYYDRARDEWCDEYVYAILRAEWLRGRAGGADGGA